MHVEFPAGHQDDSFRQLVPFTQARDGDAELP